MSKTVKTIAGEFDEARYSRFKQRYDHAVSHGWTEFELEDHTWVTKFIKYLLEFLAPHFERDQQQHTPEAHNQARTNYLREWYVNDDGPNYEQDETDLNTLAKNNAIAKYMGLKQYSAGKGKWYDDEGQPQFTDYDESWDTLMGVYRRMAGAGCFWSITPTAAEIYYRLGDLAFSVTREISKDQPDLLLAAHEAAFQFAVWYEINKPKK